MWSWTKPTTTKGSQSERKGSWAVDGRMGSRMMEALGLGSAGWWGGCPGPSAGQEGTSPSFASAQSLSGLCTAGRPWATLCITLILKQKQALQDPLLKSLRIIIFNQNLVKCK